MDWLRAGALDEDDRRAQIRQVLDAAGVAEAASVARVLAELVALPVFALATDRVISHLRHAASPRRAILALQDIVHALEETRGDASPVFVEPILGLTIELAGASGRAARLLTADPALAMGMAAQLEPESHAHEGTPFEMHLSRIVQVTAGRTDDFLRALRRYRNRQMLRIALRELRDADVRQTSAEIADLASACLQAALLHHLPLLVEQYGELDPPCEHVVMGMGKLGGRELNFSSDIDVIYVYEHDQGGAGDLTSHQFHVKLFERVSTALASITEHGMVFRVDVDLRPEGSRGPLANSLAGMERYYETWGRTWERAAWIKARPVAGSMHLGQRVQDSLRPFVYRRSLDIDAIKEIVEMKAKIDRQQRQASLSKIGRGLNLKLGRGGIREIEFYVQAHQLLYGGRDTQLRQGNTLEALAAIEAAGWVPVRTQENLTDAYLFLRKLEHRIQIVEEQQTHKLPSGAEELNSIARSLGYGSGAGLRAVLDLHMNEVHATFEGLLGHVDEDRDEQGPAPDPEVELVANPEVDDEDRRAALAAFGAAAPESALASLDAATRFSSSPLHPQASLQKHWIGIAFLHECLTSPNVDRALTHLPDLIRRLAIHRSYLSALDRPTLRRGIARTMASSDLLARILTSNPALLSRVLYAADLTPPSDLKASLAARLEGLEDDIEASLALLRTFQQEKILQVGLADLAGQLEQPTVALHLSTLAEVLVEAALDLARRELVARFGAPEDPDAGLVIMAGGTLGAGELGYRSDVDLSALYVGAGETQGGTRGPVEIREFYTRLMQRLVSFLTMRMPQGDLYPVDLRLRPSGTQGPLVANLASFERYHLRESQLWERQALVRTRIIAGRSELRPIVQDKLHQATYDLDIPRDAARQIHQMRERIQMERSAPSKRRTIGPAIDLKLGAGGLVEIEFLVQYLLLVYGREAPEVRHASTRAALDALGRAGVLDSEIADRLCAAQEHLRRIQNWLRMAHDKMLDVVDLDPEQLRPLALAVGYAGQEAQLHLVRDIEADTGVIHATYTEFVASAAS